MFSMSWCFLWFVSFEGPASNFDEIQTGTILPAKSDSDFIFCLQSYQGHIIDRSLRIGLINK